MIRTCYYTIAPTSIETDSGDAGGFLLPTCGLGGGRMWYNGLDEPNAVVIASWLGY